MEADIPETVLLRIAVTTGKGNVVKGSTVLMSEYKEVFAALPCVINPIPLLSPVSVIIPQFLQRGEWEEQLLIDRNKDEFKI